MRLNEVDCASNIQSNERQVNCFDVLYNKQKIPLGEEDLILEVAMKEIARRQIHQRDLAFLLMVGGNPCS